MTLAPIELSESEIAMFGGKEQAETFLNIINRVRKSDVEGVQALSEEVRAEQRAAQLNNFRAEIANAVPDFGHIISSKRWQKFVGTYNPIAGKTIGAALMEADARLDRTAVIGIFEEFRKNNAPSTPKAEALAVPGRMASAPLTTEATTRFAFKESYAADLVSRRNRREIGSAEFHASMEKYETALGKGLVKLGE